MTVKNARRSRDTVLTHRYARCNAKRHGFDCPLQHGKHKCIVSTFGELLLARGSSPPPCQVLSSRGRHRRQAPVTPALDFSGVIFGNYGLRTDSAAKASLGGKSPNNFTVERAYLNFRMPAGDNGQIRITTDVFQNTNNATNGFYQGWVVRIKYGYLQYTASGTHSVPAQI